MTKKMFFNGAIVMSLVVGCAASSSSGTESTADPTSPSPSSAPSDSPILYQPDAGQTCNDLPVGSTTVVPVSIDGPAPVPAGGTITDGTYEETEETWYGASTQLAGSVASVLRFTNGVWEWRTEGEYGNATYTVSGTNTVTTTRCLSYVGLPSGLKQPDGSSHAAPFTASGDHFQTFSTFAGHTVVTTYVRRE